MSLRFVANCYLCSWTQKCDGVWASHYAARKHLKEEHPAAYTLMLEKETEAAVILERLRKRFGQAASRRTP